MVTRHDLVEAAKRPVPRPGERRQDCTRRRAGRLARAALERGEPGVPPTRSAAEPAITMRREAATFIHRLCAAGLTSRPPDGFTRFLKLREDARGAEEQHSRRPPFPARPDLLLCVGGMDGMAAVSPRQPLDLRGDLAAPASSPKPCPTPTRRATASAHGQEARNSIAAASREPCLDPRFAGLLQRGRHP